MKSPRIKCLFKHPAKQKKYSFEGKRQHAICIVILANESFLVNGRILIKVKHGMTAYKNRRTHSFIILSIQCVKLSV